VAIRAVLAFVVSLAVAVLTSFYVSSLWSDTVLVGRTFSSTSEWWSPLHLLNLVDECVLLFISGVVLALAATLSRPLSWGLGLGAAFCAFRFALGSNWFSAEAPVSTYVWAYSSYYIPVVFGGLGTLVGSARRRRGVIRAA
jgi:hypothetical protein